MPYNIKPKLLETMDARFHRRFPLNLFETVDAKYCRRLFLNLLEAIYHLEYSIVVVLKYPVTDHNPFLSGTTCGTIHDNSRAARHLAPYRSISHTWLKLSIMGVLQFKML